MLPQSALADETSISRGVYPASRHLSHFSAKATPLSLVLVCAGHDHCSNARAGSAHLYPGPHPRQGPPQFGVEIAQHFKPLQFGRGRENAGVGGDLGQDVRRSRSIGIARADQIGYVGRAPVPHAASGHPTVRAENCRPCPPGVPAPGSPSPAPESRPAACRPRSCTETVHSSGTPCAAGASPAARRPAACRRAISRRHRGHRSPR